MRLRMGWGLAVDWLRFAERADYSDDHQRWAGSREETQLTREWECLDIMQTVNTSQFFKKFF